MGGAVRSVGFKKGWKVGDAGQMVRGRQLVDGGTRETGAWGRDGRCWQLELEVVDRRAKTGRRDRSGMSRLAVRSWQLASRTLPRTSHSSHRLAAALR